MILKYLIAIIFTRLTNHIYVGDVIFTIVWTSIRNKSSNVHTIIIFKTMVKVYISCSKKDK